MADSGCDLGPWNKDFICINKAQELGQVLTVTPLLAPLCVYLSEQIFPVLSYITPFWHPIFYSGQIGLLPFGGYSLCFSALIPVFLLSPTLYYSLGFF